MKKIKVTLAQLQMLKRIVEYALVTKQSITSSISSLFNAFTVLAGKVTNADSLYQQYVEVITGIALQKKQARLDLAVISYVVMKTTYAYAVNNNDNILKNKVKTNLSKLKNRGFVKLAAEMGDILSIVQPIAGNLQSYNPNITIDLATMQTRLNALNTILNQPQSAIEARKLLGRNVNTTVADAMKLTRTTIDAIVASTMIALPDYHDGYFVQRIIIDPANRHTTLNATVINELGQNFGPGIIVTVDAFTKTDPNNSTKTKTFKAKSALTDIDGTAVIKTFEPGNRTVTISGPGIIEKKFPAIHFQAGKELTMVFTVQPDFNNLPAPQSNVEKQKVNK